MVASAAMSEREPGAAGLSFGGVADEYDRARPSYLPESAAWLTGDRRATVLELGAGSGLLTEQLTALGHRVIATDPLAQMLGHLVRRAPAAAAVRATAEAIPVHSQSVDVVVAAQAFHWFDPVRSLPEAARVLRPGGHVALTWNLRDERIPWVRRLGRLIGSDEHESDPTHRLLASNLFGYVETTTFRLWQQLGRDRLRDLVVSRSRIASMGESERSRVLRDVDALYDEYGRGHDGMLLPYVSHCYRAVVKPQPRRSAFDDDLLVDFG